MVPSRLFKALAYLLLVSGILLPIFFSLGQGSLGFTDFVGWIALGIVGFAAFGTLAALGAGMRGLASQMEEHEDDP